MKEQLLLLQKKAVYLLPVILFVYTWYLYFSLMKAQSQNEKIEVPNLIFEAKRIVHLDLKGAPPRIPYYKHLFPFLAKLGTNGLLIEYEDMFPYSGDTLKHIPAENAYTLKEIATINSLAEENNLTVIPLVQTFGHLEFLLKLKKFKFLREVPKYPQVICPTHNMTLNILTEMLHQVIEAHPKSKMIHIGADEVYHIGECDRCRAVMYNYKLTNQQLFIRHIKRIASHIKLRYPRMKILMWDDEFRSIPIEELQDSGLNVLVELVIWKYTPNVLSELSFELFDKYTAVFKTVWFASAFKGATGSNKYLTPIEHHVSNHESWMKIYKRYKDKVKIGGILITGWQRYDHFSVLCELLPVGIPSLAFSLGVLSGFYSESMDLYSNSNAIVNSLDCKYYYSFTNSNSEMPNCNYPGGEILDAIIAYNQFKLTYNNFKEVSSVVGWLGDYQSNHNFSNPDIVNWILTHLSDLLGQLTTVDSFLTHTMIKVYDKYTVSEWQESFVKPIYNEINKMMDICNRLLAIDTWPRRPW